MADNQPLSVRIDAVNGRFTNRVKSVVLGKLPELDTESLEWLVREHYQFSSTNVELLGIARDSTAKLANQGVTVELQRNMDEEGGHARMYREAMRLVGTDVDDRSEFPPTSRFFDQIRDCPAVIRPRRSVRSTPPRPRRSSSIRPTTRSAARSAGGAVSTTPGR